MSATEDGITDLMADYLRDRGIDTLTQVSIPSPGTRSQPDFQITDGGTFVGEAKWEEEKWEGLSQARDYGQLTGVAGSFLISYPAELRNSVGRSGPGGDAAESVLEGHEFTCAFLKRDQPTDIVTVDIDELPDWILSNIANRRRPHADPDEVVSVLRQTAHRLNEELQQVPDENLFRNVLGATPDEDEEREAARQAAGYLLTNQITFYRVLSAHKGFPDIDPDGLQSPGDLGEYFRLVLDHDYTPVYSFEIARDLPQESLALLRDALKSIYALNPERINHDVLGKVFHELIPVSARKKVAAYYTRSEAGTILASLAIDDPDATVLEPACGSGTLLAAAYQRKRDLTSGFTEADHRRFAGADLTGIDVMPFAAHLSCIHVALQAPVYETDEVNIGIADTTRLNPGDEVDKLSFVLPESSRQRGLADFTADGVDVGDEEHVEMGGTSMDATGRTMELDTVDVVIMNPPYSRQESIARFADGYKSDLQNQFSRRQAKGQLHGKMSFCSYFVFLADKFLEPGGRIAAVLPASILNKTSDAGVREMLLEEYTLEHVVARGDESSLSEDTNLREVLLVARKGQPGEDASTAYTTLDGLDVDAEALRRAARESARGDVRPGDEYASRRSDGPSFVLRRFPSDQLEPFNLFSPLAVQNHRLFELWSSVESSAALSHVEAMETGLTGGSGGGIPYWNEGVLNEPHDYLRKDDVWVVADASDGRVRATHRHVGESVAIPESALEPYFHRYAHREAMDVSGMAEYTVVGSFEGADRFMRLADRDGVPDGWAGHVDRRTAHLGIPDRFDFTAPGTRLPAYYSDERRMYHRMWMFPALPRETAKAYAVWFCSSVGLLQFLLRRVPYRGGWGKYHRHTLAKFEAPDPEAAPGTVDSLARAFESVGRERYPSLVEQLVRCASPATLDRRARRRLERAFEATSGELGAGFAPRREMDERVLLALGFDRGVVDEMLPRLYGALIEELVGLNDLMR